MRHTARIDEWKPASFGRIRKVPSMEAQHWRNERTLQQSHLRRDWFPEEVDRLIQMIEQGYGYAAIARRLKRTPVAVVIKCKRLRCGRITTTLNTLSARDVADLLGKGCGKSATYWIGRGMLPARNAGTKRRPLWRVQWDDLLLFLEKREHWMAWEPERITDPLLREWALDLRAGPHRWLTPGEVGKQLGVGYGAVNDWIHKGLLAATRYANWWVWSGDLEGFTIPGDRPHNSNLYADGLPLRCLALLPATARELANRLEARVPAINDALLTLERRGLAQRSARRLALWSAL